MLFKTFDTIQAIIKHTGNVQIHAFIILKNSFLPKSWLLSETDKIEIVFTCVVLTGNP